MEYAFIGGIVMLIIQAIGAGMMASAAEDKGYSDRSSVFAKCFFLGIFGYMYVIALPDINTQSRMQTIEKKLDKIYEQQQSTQTTISRSMASASKPARTEDDSLPPL